MMDELIKDLKSIIRIEADLGEERYGTRRGRDCE